jgi:serine/threonine-protein kinase
VEAGLADRVTLPQPGDVIAGKYRIDCAIGSGGMGAVYQVTHRVTGKRFALKWLLPQISGSGDAAQRFIREAQVAGRFEHPNVVEVYDVGSEGDSFYMVMELLEGESLAERVDRSGPLSVTEVCELLIPCMRGVAEAHGAGIVHRDLKPANIFICKAARNLPEFGKVLDFGISKMSGAPGGELGEGMTKSGTLIGTPHYMPLEQMRGRAVDHRADIYAFGVVLYQVLSGNLPYPADSFSDLVLMLAHDAPEPLDEIPGMPRGLSQVVAHAMARDAADRFQSIDELIAALEPYATGGESIPPQPSIGRRSLDSSLSLPTPLSTESRISGRVSAYSQPPAPSRAPWIVGIGAFVLVAVVAGVFWLRHDRAQVAAAPSVVKPSAAAAPPEAAQPPVQPSAATAATPKPSSAEVELPELNIVRTGPEPKPTGSATGGQLVPSTLVQEPPAPAVERESAAVRAPAPAAKGGVVARAKEQRLQVQRQPPQPESAAETDHGEIPVKKQADVRMRAPSSRVPAISETDFY